MGCVLEIAGTNRLATVGDRALLSILDQILDLLVESLVEVTGDVALLDGFLGLALADDHVCLVSSLKRDVRVLMSSNFLWRHENLEF